MPVSRVVRPGIVPALGSLATRATRLEMPRDPDWMYVTPVAPVTEPDDYIAGFVNYTAWASPWENVGDPEFATAYRLFEGKPQIRIAATGGEEEGDSLMWTLPADFRPTKDHHLLVRMGEFGEAVGAVDVYASTGEVVFVGEIAGGIDGGGP